MHYYGTRLTENISRRDPEGYLLCLNVPVARTGIQEYLPEELGLPKPEPSARRLPGNREGRGSRGRKSPWTPVECEGVEGATAKPLRKCHS